MYFVPPTPAANISSNCQNPVDVRQHLQRFAYTLNHHHNSGVPQTTNQTAREFKNLVCIINEKICLFSFFFFFPFLSPSSNNLIFVMKTKN